MNEVPFCRNGGELAMNGDPGSDPVRSLILSGSKASAETAIVPAVPLETPRFPEDGTDQREQGVRLMVA